MSAAAAIRANIQTSQALSSFRLNPGPAGSSTPEKKPNLVRKWCVDVIDTTLSFNGFWALATLASSVNKVVGIAFNHLKEGSDFVAAGLKWVTDCTSLASVFYSLRFWVKEESKKSLEIISQIFQTMRGMCSTALFFAEKGLFSLAKIAINIGQLPVLSLVTSGLTSLATIFMAAHTYEEYKRISAAQVNFRAIIAKTKLSDISVEEAEKGLKANQIRLNILKFDVVRNIAAIAFQILMVLGMATGWGALAMTGAFLLTYSIVNTTTWIYSSYLKQKHTKVEETSEKKIIENKPKCFRCDSIVALEPSFTLDQALEV